MTKDRVYLVMHGIKFGVIMYIKCHVYVEQDHNLLKLSLSYFTPFLKNDYALNNTANFVMFTTVDLVV